MDPGTAAAAPQLPSPQAHPPAHSRQLPVRRPEPVQAAAQPHNCADGQGKEGYDEEDGRDSTQPPESRGTMEVEEQEAGSEQATVDLTPGGQEGEEEGEAAVGGAWNAEVGGVGRRGLSEAVVVCWRCVGWGAAY